MGIRSLDWNSWIEMDSNFLPYHSAKVSELEKGGEKHIAFVDHPQTRRACFEVYEELVLFLTRRYPNIFRKERREKSDGGKRSKEVVTNALTGEAFSWPAESPELALEYAGLLIQDDIMLMVKNPDGNYRLDAACVCLSGFCLSGFWRLHEKIRTSLDVTRMWNWLGECYIHRRNFEISASHFYDGGTSCMSGRTNAVRTEILQDPGFLSGFCNGSWGKFRLNADDDNFVTRWLFDHDWKTYIQYNEECMLETTLEANPMFLAQCLRWARSNWRSNYTTLFIERNVYR